MHGGNASLPFFFYDVFRVVVDRRRRIHSFHCLRYLATVHIAQDHELQRFRQEHDHEEADHQRYSATKIKNGAPAVIGNQPCCQETAQCRAEIETICHKNHRCDAFSCRGVFAHQCQCIRHNSTESDAGNETNGEELVDRSRLRGGERENREKERGCDQHRPAAHLIGQGAERQRSDQNSEQRCAEHRTHEPDPRVPVLDQRRCGVAHGLHIETVDHQAHATENTDCDVERSNLAVVHNVGDIHFC